MSNDHPITEIIQAEPITDLATDRELARGTDPRVEEIALRMRATPRYVPQLPPDSNGAKAVAHLVQFPAFIFPARVEPHWDAQRILMERVEEIQFEIYHTPGLTKQIFREPSSSHLMYMRQLEMESVTPGAKMKHIRANAVKINQLIGENLKALDFPTLRPRERAEVLHELQSCAMTVRLMHDILRPPAKTGRPRGKSAARVPLALRNRAKRLPKPDVWSEE